MKEKFYKNWIILPITIFFICVFILNNIPFKGNVQSSIFDFFIKTLGYILSLFCLGISVKLKTRYLSFGWIFLSIYIFGDIINIMKYNIVDTGITNIVFNSSFLLGMIFIAYGFLKAIVERENLLEEITHTAFNDSLTELPNRRDIEKNIEKALSENKKFAILFVDLDKFKLINDSLGHSHGDYILKKVARRIKENIREEDYLARSGGDEFLIILNDIENENEIAQISKKIVRRFRKPFELEDSTVHITCSIGICLYPKNGDNMETLMKNADIAMHKTKEKQGNGYQFYNDNMHSQIKNKFDIAESLIIGIQKDEFILHYQPKVDIMTNQIIGVEALVRWNHTKKGMIYPNEFIPIAEETGFIKTLDKHILKLACLQIRDWIDRGKEPINISVNVSPKLLHEESFIPHLEAVFESTKIDPKDISIEIIETAAMEDKEYVYNVLNILRSKGIKILLDDFGKGYSSLSYLKDLPIDKVKIDKVFVDEICFNNVNRTIMKAIIDMSTALNLKVLAEGVENVDQLNLLEELDCQSYQGYLYSKPVSIENLEKMIYEDEKKGAII
ncbi:putative bifunctional diguanylate cyclase/phosphodiesterase [Tepidibacter hydrothermalis]|uniref:EAL domain-containing protein n=1 Tax=Tepidibacter hydrothermalis TaxID=3036126 RepID=A0ABY8E9J8_9FIRM|nr:EAL domain-containing protein [Tepidibacter hydrothermalis]WFD09577.1 EAL domain-containing protein [Tepidibacter hydrothermalis]